MDYQTLDQFIKKYYPGYEGDVGFYFKKLLDHVVVDGSSLLDAGCGRQSYGGAFYKRAAKKVGIDLDAKAAKENTALDTVTQGSLERLPFPDASFDIVVAQWVFEHIQNPKTCAEEISRVLKPKGVLLFMTPNAWSPFVLMTRFLPLAFKKFLRKRFLSIDEADTYPTHYRMNTELGLNRLFQKHGMRPHVLISVDCFTYMKFSRPLVFLFIMLARTFDALQMSLLRHHLVGVYQKQ